MISFDQFMTGGSFDPMKALGVAQQAGATAMAAQQIPTASIPRAPTAPTASFVAPTMATMPAPPSVDKAQAMDAMRREIVRRSGGTITTIALIGGAALLAYLVWRKRK